MRKPELVLVGGGRFSEEVAEVATMLGFNVLGYVDFQKTPASLDYLGCDDDVLPTLPDDVKIFPAFGVVDRKSLSLRSTYLGKIDHKRLPQLVSPHSTVSSNVSLSDGIFIAHGVVINTYANISRGVVINSNSTIGHDVSIGPDSVISGNVFIGGGCAIGAEVLVGPGAVVLQNLEVGDNSIVSVGSVVGRNLPKNSVTVPPVSKVISVK